MQQDGLGLLWRECADCFPDRCNRLVGGQIVGWTSRRFRLIGAEWDFSSPPAPPQMVYGAAQAYPQDVRLRVRMPVKTRQFPPDDSQNFLEHVFRILGRGHNPRDYPQHHVLSGCD